MVKYNHDYAKPDKDGYPLFCPMPLKYTVPRHEEWDEDVTDPETGEPTEEKEHHERDWTEEVVVAIPSKSDAAKAGYLQLYDNDPGLHEQGKHWERTGKIVYADTYYFWEYALVDDPTPQPRRWSRFSIKGALADAHLLPAAKAFLGAYEMKSDYTALEAFTDVDYIEEGYGGDEAWNALLDGVAQALGKTRAEIDQFLAQIPTEGAQ